MGVSTDAILCFGVDLSEDYEDLLPWQQLEDDDNDFDTWVARISGADTDDWKAIKEAAEKCPVELVSHCSYDYPMYIVAVRGTKITARRGSPKVISLDAIGGDDFIERQIAAERFCEEHGIPCGDFQWLLCSMWG